MSATETPVPPAVRPTDRWLVLVGALLIQTILGTVYGFSVFVKPLTAAPFGWTNSEVQWAFNLALLVFALTMIPAGRLQDKRGPRLPALIGAGLLFVAYLLTSRVDGPEDKVLWWLSYGVLGGAGIGFAYVCPIAALAKWFPDIKGLITGIAVAGFGGGAAVFGPSVSDYLNPDKGGHTLSEFFLVHAIGAGIAVLIGALLLRNPPAGYRVPSKAAAPGAAAAPKPATADADWSGMLRTSLFYLIWLMFFANAMAGLMTIGLVKSLVKDVPGMSEDLAKTAITVLSLANAGGRIMWGAVSDRLGRLNTLTVMFVLQTFAMLFMKTGLDLGVAPAYLLIALVGLNFGGNLALFPAATADAFGTKNLGMNYGFVFTAYGIGGVVGPQMAAMIKDRGLPFGLAFLIAGICVAVTIVLSLVYKQQAAKAKAAAA
ncbi:MAG: OFA family MFS transporter [Fimbriimonadaceae bacterium]|nr:OFA family MFS transporter [Fimbriimonadaceae bacterium]